MSAIVNSRLTRRLAVAAQYALRPRAKSGDSDRRKSKKRLQQRRSAWKLRLPRMRKDIHTRRPRFARTAACTRYCRVLAQRGRSGSRTPAGQRATPPAPEREATTSANDAGHQSSPARARDVQSRSGQRLATLSFEEQRSRTARPRRAEDVIRDLAAWLDEGGPDSQAHLNHLLLVARQGRSLSRAMTRVARGPCRRRSPQASVLVGFGA